ncbi:hypothetical protein HDU88_007884 [Geranomyces variabilis]|nr:hypothetical protein HDU88_007884 [Geranomyces variabilis]
MTVVKLPVEILERIVSLLWIKIDDFRKLPSDFDPVVYEEQARHQYLTAVGLRLTRLRDEILVDDATFSIYNAAIHGHKYGQPLELGNAVDLASAEGHLNVLDWWNSSGWPMQYTALAVDAAPTPEVLSWWRNSGLELKYSEESMDMLEAGQADTKALSWWLQQKDLKLKYSARAMDRAGTTEVLDWWFASGLELEWTEDSMDQTDAIAILDWWVQSPLECRFSSRAIRGSSLHVLMWWKARMESGDLRVKFDYAHVLQNIEMLENPLGSDSDSSESEELPW